MYNFFTSGSRYCLDPGPDQIYINMTRIRNTGLWPHESVSNSRRRYIVEKQVTHAFLLRSLSSYGIRLTGPGRERDWYMDMRIGTTLIDRYPIYTYSETKAPQKVDILLVHTYYIPSPWSNLDSKTHVSCNIVFHARFSCFTKGFFKIETLLLRNTSTRMSSIINLSFTGRMLSIFPYEGLCAPPPSKPKL